MDKRRKGFLHAYRGAAAADVPCERKEFPDMYHLAVFVARDAGGNLEVHLERAWHHANEQPGLVPSQHKGLEYLVDIFPQLRGHMAGIEIVFINLVWYQLIMDSGSVQQACGVGLGNLFHPLSVFFTWSGRRFDLRNELHRRIVIFFIHLYFYGTYDAERRVGRVGSEHSCRDAVVAEHGGSDFGL